MTDSQRTTMLIRLMVGIVFLSEGIQKFLFTEDRGAGRFAKIRLPSPDFLGSFVGGFEILCGGLVLAGLLIRIAVIPLIVIMVVAIISTKIPQLAENGFWEMLHASRTDLAMLLGSIFLLMKGGGWASVDKKIYEAK